MNNFQNMKTCAKDISDLSKAIRKGVIQPNKWSNLNEIKNNINNLKEDMRKQNIKNNNFNFNNLGPLYNYLDKVRNLNDLNTDFINNFTDYKTHYNTTITRCNDKFVNNLL